MANPVVTRKITKGQKAAPCLSCEVNIATKSSPNEMADITHHHLQSLFKDVGLSGVSRLDHAIEPQMTANSSAMNRPMNAAPIAAIRPDNPDAKKAIKRPIGKTGHEYRKIRAAFLASIGKLRLTTGALSQIDRSRSAGTVVAIFLC